MKCWLSILCSWSIATGFSQNSNYFDSLETALAAVKGAEFVDAVSSIPYDIMISDFTRSSELFEQANIQADKVQYVAGKADVLSKLATVKYLQGNYEQSLEYNLQSIEFYETLNMNAKAANGYCNVGYQMKRRDLPKAIHYMQLGLSMLEKSGDSTLLEPGYGNYGVLLQMAGELDSAIVYYKQALSISESRNDSVAIPFSLNKLGEAYCLNNNFESAKSYFDKAFLIRSMRNDTYGVMENYTFYGDYYFYQQHYDSAIVNYNIAVEMSKAQQYPYLAQYCYEMLSQAYAGMGNYERALEYQKLFTTTKDSLVNEQRAAQLAELELRFETAQKDKENLELKQENADIELSNARQRTWIIGLGFGTLALVFVGLFIMQRNKRNEKAKRDAAVISEREKGIKAVFGAQEKERARISKELHDGLGQQLTGIKMGFQRISKALQGTKEVTAELEKLTHVIDDSAIEVRAISHQLMPKTLTEFGLAPAIEDMLQKSLGLAGINYKFEAFESKLRLSETAELGLFRICQEAVNNVQKHAKATQVTVQLLKAGGKLVLVIEDNGKGINFEMNNDGHGITNIKSRARTIGAEINIESNPGRGTVLSIRIPL